MGSKFFFSIVDFIYSKARWFPSTVNHLNIHIRKTLNRNDIIRNSNRIELIKNPFDKPLYLSGGGRWIWSGSVWSRSVILCQIETLKSVLNDYYYIFLHILAFSQFRFFNNVRWVITIVLGIISFAWQLVLPWTSQSVQWVIRLVYSKKCLSYHVFVTSGMFDLSSFTHLRVAFLLTVFTLISRVSRTLRLRRCIPSSLEEWECFYGADSMLSPTLIDFLNGQSKSHIPCSFLHPAFQFRMRTRRCVLFFVSNFPS